MTGSVKVVSDGPIGGVLRFDLPGIGVAGVGASQPVRDAIFPARRQAGGIGTSAAIRNLGEEAMGVSCRLMQEGVVLEEVEIPLSANGQEARFIEQVFTRTDTSDFVGSVRCTAPGLFQCMEGAYSEAENAHSKGIPLPEYPLSVRGNNSSMYRASCPLASRGISISSSTMPPLINWQLTSIASSPRLRMAAAVLRSPSRRAGKRASLTG